jgi:hypothetical protein
MKLKDLLKEHIEKMKFREQEQLEKENQAHLKWKAIEHERFELEYSLDKLDAKEQSQIDKLRSLVK